VGRSLGRDLAELRTDLLRDLGLHQLAGDEGDCLEHEVAVLAGEYALNDIGNRHPLAFGYRGASLIDFGKNRRVWGPRWEDVRIVVELRRRSPRLTVRR